MLIVMRHTFQSEQWVPYPRERVFAFFADPANLPPLMPRWQHAQVVSAPDAAGVGSLITIRFRPVPLLPLRLEWEALITEFRWNDFFCDEQRRGPFKYFRHCHRLREQRNGTVVSDNLEYELPFGVMGDLANSLIMKRQIQSLFRHRQKMLPILLARG